MRSAGTAKDATALSAMLQKEEGLGHEGRAEARRVMHVHDVFP
jgi:hypothetical protein